MHDIVFEANRISEWLSRHGREAARLLRPGAPLLVIETAENKLGYTFPAELIVILQWHDGTSVEMAASLGEARFIPGFYLCSLQEGQGCIEDGVSTGEWNPGWFPVFASGAGDFMLVDCLKGNGTYAPVLEYRIGGLECVVEYDRLTTMFATIAECYESGAYYLVGGSLEVDEDKFMSIRRRLNPGVLAE